MSRKRKLIFVLGSLIGIVLIIIFAGTSPTVNDILVKAKGNMSRCNYGAVQIHKLYSTPEESYRTSTALTFDLVDKRTESIIRDDESDLYQFWYDKGDVYETYVYSEDVDSYVQFFLDEEPYSMNIWGVLDDMSKYALQKDRDVWDDKECYTFLWQGTAEGWPIIYELLYIDVESYLPVAIVTYASQSTDTDTTNIIMTGSSFSGIVDEIKGSEQNEVFVVHEFEYSKEPIEILLTPEEYLTEEEYNFMWEGDK